MGPSDSQRMALRLTAMRYGAREILLYELEPLDGNALPPVSAGAHLDLHLPGDLIRQYSLITSLCDAERYVVGVKRDAEGRGGSRWLHDQARVGQTLEVSLPRNHFPLSVAETPVCLIAGGIGITPIYSMFKALQQTGRPVQLHYWSRSPEHALFRRELETAPGVTLHFARASGPQSDLLALLGNLTAETEIYACGPGSMLDQLDSSGLGERLHVERFVSAGPVLAEGAFNVVLARSGHEYVIPPGETILNVLLEAGEDVLYSCEQGVCGACEVKVLEGQPVHGDTVYSAEEHTRRSSMMICCSSSASARLLLDI
ncbi:PDR/VanB family oxidoreductase [Halopseudomonas pelagia]|uniref:PDR/VanB family oxidoreductase n=1 Tax=Halopseudomonas pelagia TaxID=553151 RepID=UPI0003A4B682|nr:PDR/VanB family oxidoreductase [Halopseudomonas pelagia]|tara:strand:+ start:11967 stop:12911 length:945 start_codon:yes stop_codon:yes gene_type:complete